MEAEFSEKPQQPAEAEFYAQNSETVQEGRKSWRYVKDKVPAYKWEASDGVNKFELKADSMAKGAAELVLRFGQRRQKSHSH